MGSPAAIFSGSLSGGTALANLGGTDVNVPQVNYPTYVPATPPGYTPPVVNQSAPDATTFYDAQQLELQDYTNQADSQIQNAGLEMQTAGYNAYQTAFNAGQARSSEALQYTASGVTLQGSPLLVLEQTRQQGLQEIQMIEQQGVNQAQLGYQQAFQTVNQGRAVLLGQDIQFGGQVQQWGTQATVNEIQSISQQQQQASQYVGQNTANVINAYSQRQPVYQVNQNNAVAQGLQGLGNVFPNKQPVVSPTIPVGAPVIGLPSGITGGGVPLSQGVGVGNSVYNPYSVGGFSTGSEGMSSTGIPNLGEGIDLGIS